MNLYLTGWECNGVRAPDMSIDLTESGSVPQVSLVQMPNGTGKTTTKELLKATLDGSAETWSPDHVLQFRQTNSMGSAGRFTVHLSTDEEPVSIILNLDFEEGVATYQTQAPSLGGIRNGHQPPSVLDRFLKPEFVGLFVFDGELAETLLDSNETEASEAIDTLSQLYLLDELRREAEAYWNDLASAQGATTEQGLKTKQNKLARVQQRLKELQQKKERLERDYDDINERLVTLNAQKHERIGRNEGNRQKRDEYNEIIAEVDNEEARVLYETIILARNPNTLSATFRERLSKLKHHLDTLRLPESTSKQFFTELSRQDTCVCGRPLDDTHKEAVLEHAETYLDSDESGVINKLKSDIDQTGAMISDEPEEHSFNYLVDYLQSLDQRRRDARSRLESIESELKAQGDEEFERIVSEIKVAENTLSKHKKLLEKLSLPESNEPENEPTKMVSIPALQAEETKLSDQISEITNTVELRKKCETIKAIAQRTKNRVRESIKSKILDRSNQRLREILSHEPILIDSIDSSIKLANQTGASVGQTLAVGYTFLMSLFESRQNSFPFVVDSPANALDIPRRKEIARFIPKLCHQFVAFTISTEREGFVDPLCRNARSINFLTVYRNSPGNKHLIDSLPEDLIPAGNQAAVVHGEQYFRVFDIESEE